MPEFSQNLAPGSLLGQSAPANTTAAALFTASVRTEVTLVIVCNTTGTSAAFRLFHDEGGSTYAASNALYYDKSIAANETFTFAPGELGTSLVLAPTDTLGIRTDTNNALTFSAYGVTQQVF